MSELFPIEAVAMDSPRLAWMKRHGLILHSPPADLIGSEDDYGDKIHAFYAERHDQGAFDKAKVGMGKTSDEALLDWAVKAKVPAWNEEGGA